MSADQPDATLEIPRPLKVGDVLIHPDGTIHTLLRRKVEAEHAGRTPWAPGWWIVGGGGLSDSVIDRQGYMLLTLRDARRLYDWRRDVGVKPR